MMRSIDLEEPETEQYVYPIGISPIDFIIVSVNLTPSSQEQPRMA
jgi:hypothetical protein